MIILLVRFFKRPTILVYAVVVLVSYSAAISECEKGSRPLLMMAREPRRKKKNLRPLLNRRGMGFRTSAVHDHHVRYLTVLLALVQRAACPPMSLK